MITFRRNPFSETSIDIPFKEGENGKELIDRVLAENGYELTEPVYAHFNLVVNGHIIEKDMWSFVAIKEGDTILLGPRIARGAGAQLFKQIALVIIAVAAAAFGQAYISTGAMAAAFTAAVTISATLALNALIPPPGLGLGGIGGGSTSYEGSQMYTITGQSNNAKKYGYVPKVYGTHRIFPLIAANPYTEVEADPQTGTLIQYFYCIYDFGFGPLNITDIKIGDTPISEYGDSTYRLVDLNKPAVSEGYWDDVLHNDFMFYKGDVERDGTMVALDKNASDPNAFQDDYMAVRTASNKAAGDLQEITLDFICPQGLIAYSNTGKEYDRSIDLDIHFAQVGQTVDTWIPYNDLNQVFDFTASGGNSVTTMRNVQNAPFNTVNFTPPEDMVKLGVNTTVYRVYPNGGTQWPMGGI